MTKRTIKPAAGESRVSLRDATLAARVVYRDGRTGRLVVLERDESFRTHDRAEKRSDQQKEIKGLLGLLEQKPTKSVTDWKGRYRENLEKMKTGRLEDVAEVFKNLSEVQQRKSLSFREKKMYDRAKYLLISEVAIVKNIPEQEAEKLIYKCLEKSLVVRGH